MPPKRISFAPKQKKITDFFNSKPEPEDKTLTDPKKQKTPAPIGSLDDESLLKIFSFFDDDLFTWLMLRKVCKKWSGIIKECKRKYGSRFSQPVMIKLGGPYPFLLDDCNTKQLRIALNAFKFIQDKLSNAKQCVEAELFTGEAQGIVTAVSQKYSQITKNSLFNNCICIYKDKETNKVTLNFVQFGDWDKGDGLSTLLSGKQLSLDLSVMQKTLHMHAEIRVLHEKQTPSSVDKPMCVFCAMTFYVISKSGERYPYKVGKLEWYTFSPRIFFNPEYRSAYFGKEFACEWASASDDIRERLLQTCVALTNPETLEKVTERIEKEDKKIRLENVKKQKQANEGKRLIFPK